MNNVTNVSNAMKNILGTWYTTECEEGCRRWEEKKAQTII